MIKNTLKTLVLTTREGECLYSLRVYKDTIFLSQSIKHFYFDNYNYFILATMKKKVYTVHHLTK